jgi:hypothetical protein
LGSFERGGGGAELLHVFGPKDKQVARDKRKLCTEELHYLLYCTVRVTKLRTNGLGRM